MGRKKIGTAEAKQFVRWLGAVLGNLPFSPAEDCRCYPHSTAMVARRDAVEMSRVAGPERVLTKFHGIVDVTRNPQAVFLQQAKQLVEIVGEGEMFAPLDENSLKALLCRLLGFKAKILQLNAGDDVSGKG